MDVLKKTPVREQDAKVRATNFEEVCYGYNKEEAVEEASRCLNCKNAQCVKGCPVSIDIPTVVSLNPIMVAGTGMCGACRVTVGGKVKFACVDGPEFDGHLVNFDEAMQRQQIYKTAEGRAFLAAKEGDTHHGGCGNCGGDN